MYKKIIKIILGILIDCAIIYCVHVRFLLLRLWKEVTYTSYPEGNELLCMVIFLAFYIAFAWYNRWITPGISLMTGRRDKNSATVSVSKIALATFLDWFSIFSLMLVLNLCLRQFVFISVYVLFTVVAFFYYTVSFLTMKQTLGYVFCHIELVSKQENSHWFGCILKRELCKFGFGAWLPFGLYSIVFQDYLCYIWHPPYFIILNVLFLLFYYTAKGEAWWNSIGSTEVRKKNNTLKMKYLLRFSYIICMGLIFLVFLLYNNINNTSSDKFLGFKIPFKRIEYPARTQKVKPYLDFLKEHGRDPKEYLLSLFDQYDIVVLCENVHSEDTQWDFIYDVVTDRRFVEKAGHIFTEYGCMRDQEKVDSFMHTSFADSISLAKATATLLQHMHGNFYFFMQKLYRFNQTLPDSMQIQEHFTDAESWKYLRNAYYDTILNDMNSIAAKRDSVMAQVVIDWYAKTGRKCLVVTNYTHAFAVRNSTDTKRYPNEAKYIHVKYPEKMANIMLHGKRGNGFYHVPIQRGLWDRVMKKNGNIPVGFNFEGSPFGKAKFDRYTGLNKYRCLHQDVFTGYVFYNPEEKYTYSDACYRRYAAEKEYEWAVQNHLIDTVTGKECINYYQDTGGKIEERNAEVLYLNLYHFIDVLLWGVWAIIVLFIVVVSLLGIMIKKQITAG